jgi:hypothetical protein
LNGHYHDYGDIDSGFVFSYAATPAGPYTIMFTVVNTSSDTSYDYNLPSGLSGTLYIMAKDTHPTTDGTSNDRLHIDCMYVRTQLPAVAPYATGDGFNDGLGPTDKATNFALYGASHVGMLGAIVETTNVEKILQLDLLVTDYYHAQAYPTYLYYNPYSTSQSVQIDAGTCPVDLYDTVSQTFLNTNVSGVTNFDIGADSAVVIVLAPTGGQVTIDGNKKLIDNVVVDYKTNTSFTTCAQVQASPLRFAGDIIGDCVVDMRDLAELVERWLDQGTCLGRADIDGNNIVNFKDLGKLAEDWLTSNNPP